MTETKKTWRDVEEWPGDDVIRNWYSHLAAAQEDATEREQAVKAVKRELGVLQVPNGIEQINRKVALETALPTLKEQLKSAIEGLAGIRNLISKRTDWGNTRGGRKTLEIQRRIWYESRGVEPPVWDEEAQEWV